MVNKFMCSVGDQMICLAIFLGIRLVTYQLHANAMTTTCDQQLYQSNLQSTQNTKPNHIFDFPHMSFVVGKIVHEILRNKFTEEESCVGWHNSKRDVVKVQKQIVKIMSQVMKEHQANLCGPFKNIDTKIAALWADLYSNVTKIIPISGRVKNRLHLRWMLTRTQNGW